MLNFYQKFLCGAARVLGPLTDALRGPGKSLIWSPALNSTFRAQRISLPWFLSLCILVLVLRSLWQLMTPILT